MFFIPKKYEFLLSSAVQITHNTSKAKQLTTSLDPASHKIWTLAVVNIVLAFQHILRPKSATVCVCVCV